jgi:hypothetical protein
MQTAGRGSDVAFAQVTHGRAGSLQPQKKVAVLGHEQTLVEPAQRLEGRASAVEHLRADVEANLAELDQLEERAIQAVGRVGHDADARCRAAGGFSCQNPLGKARRHARVGVEEEEQAPPRRTRAAILGARHTGWSVVDEADGWTCVLSLEALDDSTGGIGRAIVNHDGLQIVERRRLAGDRFQCRADIVSFVAGRNHD